MGFTVDVAEIIQYVAQCGEFGCRHRFEVRGRRAEAEDDAEEHRRAHRARWEAQQAAWEEEDA